MAVYVDNARVNWRGRHWCHMLADSLEELHGFAKLLGVHRRWFHKTASYPHYDITVEMRDFALSQGALLSDKATIISCARLLKDELVAQSRSSERMYTDSFLAPSKKRQSELFNALKIAA